MYKETIFPFSEKYIFQNYLRKDNIRYDYFSFFKKSSNW